MEGDEAQRLGGELGTKQGYCRCCLLNHGVRYLKCSGDSGGKLSSALEPPQATHETATGFSVHGSLFGFVGLEPALSVLDPQTPNRSFEPSTRVLNL